MVRTSRKPPTKVRRAISRAFLASAATTHGQTPDKAQQEATEGNGAKPTLMMVAARAELRDSINAKKAKQGDVIQAKLRENVKLSDRRELPKDTILEGHVDQVVPSEHKGDSSVVVTFDKAVLNGKDQLPIKATIASIWELPQGVSGGMSPAATMPGGQMMSGISVSGTAATAGMPASMDVPQAGMDQRSKNPVPGVTLHSDIHEKSSGTFLAKGKNVNVPGGTQIQFELVVIPPGARIQ
jgi:hypothetical protein